MFKTRHFLNRYLLYTLHLSIVFNAQKMACKAKKEVLLRNGLLPSPRINLTEIIEVFQTVVVAEQARQRLRQINYFKKGDMVSPIIFTN